MPNQGLHPLHPLRLGDAIGIWEGEDLPGFAPAARQILHNAKPPKIKGKRGRDLFDLILSGINEIYDVDAAIAGGAARDLAVGSIEHEDVDVFIPMSIDRFMEDADQLGWAKPPRIMKHKKYPEAGFISLGRGSAMVQCCEIDLIFLDKPLSPEFMANFPIHTQRIIYTLGAGLKISPEAYEDVNNKTFTIDPTIKDKDKVAKLKEKINTWLKRADYKGWTIIEPEIKEWWENAPKKP